MPSLAQLPPPPPGKTGWPWTEETPPLPETMPDGAPWPRISIVTPSYNQGQFIEETIRAVLLQGYPNLEYIINDGGSKDGSVEIIKKYEPWLAYWVSEPDGGQCHAINKGFKRSTGEIMPWINSDDLYEIDSLREIAQAFHQNPQILWVAGYTYIVDQFGNKSRGWGKPIEEKERWFIGPMVMQQGVFWKRTLWDKTNKIDETLQFSFDYELWFQFHLYQQFPLWVNKPIANFRIHPESKTSTSQQAFRNEDRIIHKRYNYLLKSPKQKLRAFKLSRQHRALKIVSHLDKKGIFDGLLLIIQSIVKAPWIVFRRSFYSRLKNWIIS